MSSSNFPPLLAIFENVRRPYPEPVQMHYREAELNIDWINYERKGPKTRAPIGELFAARERQVVSQWNAEMDAIEHLMNEKPFPSESPGGLSGVDPLYWKVREELIKIGRIAEMSPAGLKIM